MLDNNMGSQRISDIFNCTQNFEHTVLTIKNPKENILIFDKGLFNTAIGESDISRIDGVQGQLYYRGIPITQWVQHHTFEEVAHQLIFGQKEMSASDFQKGMLAFWDLSPQLQQVLDSIPSAIHPMDFLAIGVLSLSTIASQYLSEKPGFSEKVQFLITQMMVIATYYYLKQKDQTWKPKKIMGTIAKQMLYQMGHQDNNRLKVLTDFWNKLLILHAEHEQNCSTFSVRTVASSGGDLYSAIAAGIAAFKGPLHGGASQYVFEMYQEIISNKMTVQDYLKKKISQKQRVMGLGHRVYRCWDPRARIMFEMLNTTHIDDSIVGYKELANQIIQCTQSDEFFVKRNICPNPDLLNCIFYHALGVPASMNTVMLSLSRIAGWLAHYYESVTEGMPLIRPRQLSKIC